MSRKANAVNCRKCVLSISMLDCSFNEKTQVLHVDFGNAILLMRGELLIRFDRLRSALCSLKTWQKPGIFWELLMGKVNIHALHAL